MAGSEVGCPGDADAAERSHNSAKSPKFKLISSCCDGGRGAGCRSRTWTERPRFTGTPHSQWRRRLEHRWQTGCSSPHFTFRRRQVLQPGLLSVRAHSFLRGQLKETYHSWSEGRSVPTYIDRRLGAVNHPARRHECDKSRRELGPGKFQIHRKSGEKKKDGEGEIKLAVGKPFGERRSLYKPILEPWPRL